MRRPRLYPAFFSHAPYPLGCSNNERGNINDLLVQAVYPLHAGTQIPFQVLTWNQASAANYTLHDCWVQITRLA